MKMKLIAIANVIVMEYLILSYYNVPYKMVLRIVTAVILTAVVVKKAPPMISVSESDCRCSHHSGC